MRLDRITVAQVLAGLALFEAVPNPSKFLSRRPIQAKVSPVQTKLDTLEFVAESSPIFALK